MRDRARGASRRRRGHGEDGDTLIEIMMTVAVIGIIGAALLAGIGTAIRLSGIHRGQASADVALVAATEAVKTYSPGGSVTCANLTTSTYAGAISGLTNLPPGWSTSNLSITSAACLTVHAVALPKVTVKATSPDGKSSETVDVVRRGLT